jgi:hypothetical protein
MPQPAQTRKRTRSCLLLLGGDAEVHRLIADQICPEYRVKTEGRGRTVDEWKLRLAGAENHWFDCLVGAAVAASMHGAVLFGTEAKPQAKRPKMRLSKLQKQRR